MLFRVHFQKGQYFLHLLEHDTKFNYEPYSVLGKHIANEHSVRTVHEIVYICHDISKFASMVLQA